MSSTDSSLFGQGPPPTTTNYSSTSATIPTWLSQYGQGIIANANTLMAQPAPVYGGPLVAGASDLQRQSYAGVSDLARNATSPLTAAAPYLSGAAGAVNSALDPNASGLVKAAPYLAGANKSFNDPNTVASYMDPYTRNVIAANQLATNQDISQNIIPQTTSLATGTGQIGTYGGASGAFGTNLGQRLGEAEKSMNAADLAALQSGYQTGSANFQADTSRQGTLAQLAGILGTQEQGAQLQGGAQLGALGTASGQLTSMGDQMSLANLNAVNEAGTQQQQTSQAGMSAAYQQWLNQTMFPYQTTSWGAGLAGQIPTDKAVQSSATTPYGTATASPLDQLARLLSSQSPGTGGGSTGGGTLGALSAAYKAITGKTPSQSILSGLHNLLGNGADPNALLNLYGNNPMPGLGGPPATGNPADPMSPNADPNQVFGQQTPGPGAGSGIGALAGPAAGAGLGYLASTLGGGAPAALGGGTIAVADSLGTAGLPSLGALGGGGAGLGTSAAELGAVSQAAPAAGAGVAGAADAAAPVAGGFGSTLASAAPWLAGAAALYGVGQAHDWFGGNSASSIKTVTLPKDGSVTMRPDQTDGSRNVITTTGKTSGAMMEQQVSKPGANHDPGDPVLYPKGASDTTGTNGWALQGFNEGAGGNLATATWRDAQSGQTLNTTQLAAQLGMTLPEVQDMFSKLTSTYTTGRGSANYSEQPPSSTPQITPTPKRYSRSRP